MAPKCLLKNIGKLTCSFVLNEHITSLTPTIVLFIQSNLSSLYRKAIPVNNTIVTM